MGVIGKIFPMTKVKKAMIYTAIKENKELIFNKKIVFNHVNKCIESGRTSFLDIFATVNLLEFLNINSGLNEYIGCKLIKDNHAWVSVNNNGHYRYFTRSFAGVTYSLDFIDLFSIYSNTKSISSTIRIIQRTYGILFDDEWSLEQKSKYDSNQTWINDDKKLLKYPNLYSLIHKHVHILQTLNKIGDDKLIGRGMEYQGNAIFFSSVNFIKSNYMEDISLSTINQVINMFAVLGLIDKVSEESIPIEFINMSKSRMSIDKCRHNHVSFFSIPDIKSVISLAEERAKIMRENDLKYYSINKKSVERVFGSAVRDKVYVQDLRRGLKDAGDDKSNNHALIVAHLFNRSIIDYGFASKELLRKSSTLSEKKFNKLWEELTGRVECFTARPNKGLKRKYKLSTNEQIVIVR